MRWGWNFLKRGPPTPDRKLLLLCPRRGGRRILGLIFTPCGVEKQLKIFCDDFFGATAPRLHHLVPAHLTIPWFHKPPKHNVAVPINKVEGRLGGANPVGGGVGVANHPMRGTGRGSVRRGGSLEMKGGALRHHGTIAKKLYCRRWGG